MKLAFRRTLPAGQSDFEVEVPRQLALDREFSFASLRLVPGYFSAQADLDNLDPVEELESVRRLKFGFTVRNLQAKERVDGGRFFRNPDNLVERSAFVTAFNKHFDSQRPPFLLHPPVFIDWIDKRAIDKPHSEFLATVEESLPLLYAAEDTDHQNSGVSRQLPDAARANHYKVPPARTDLHAVVINNTLLRLHLAPFTTLVCSSDKQLEELGFKKPLGKREKHNRIHVHNDTGDWAVHVAEAVAPQTVPTAVKKGTVAGIDASNPLFYSTFPSDVRQEVRDADDELTEKDWRSNAELADFVGRQLSVLSQGSNLKFGVRYNAKTSTFSLQFPEGLPEFEFRFNADLSQRMGFPARETLRSGDSADARPEKESAPELLNRCLALSWDTGVVMCTPAIEGSANALMHPENNLGLLVPDASGTLRLEQLPGRPTSFRLEGHRYGSGSAAPVRFRLHRFIDDNRLLPLQWKIRSYVLGALRASPRAADGRADGR